MESSAVGAVGDAEPTSRGNVIRSFTCFLYTTSIHCIKNGLEVNINIKNTVLYQSRIKMLT